MFYQELLGALHRGQIKMRIFKAIENRRWMPEDYFAPLAGYLSPEQIAETNGYTWDSVTKFLSLLDDVPLPKSEIAFVSVKIVDADRQTAIVRETVSALKLPAR